MDAFKKYSAQKYMKINDKESLVIQKQQSGFVYLPHLSS